MMKLRLLLLFAFCLPAFAQTNDEKKRATESRDKYLFAVTTEPKKFDETVAGDFVSDEILVPVTINGKIYTFLFDTGAVTILSKELVAELGLSAVTSNKFVDSAGNTSQENFYTVAEIQFGSVKFRNVGAGSFDLSKFSRLLCRPIDGIFGSNAMRVCNWEIDYGKSSIRLASDKIRMPDADAVGFVENFSGTPRIKLDTSGINFLADVDTGNNGSLDIPTQFFEQSRLSNSPKIATGQGKGFYSLLGNELQEERLVLADSIMVGKMFVSRRVRVSASPMVLIGNDFFSPMGRFAINYSKRELLLPKKRSDPKPEKTFGFTPLLENGNAIVGVVWKNSAAEKQGLALGDVVISISGIDVSKLDKMQWCAFRTQMMEKERLSVIVQKSDGTRLEVNLEKYDLLD